MKKKYYVNVSFQAEIEAETDMQAINAAGYIGAYESTNRHLSMQVVRCVLPIQSPMPAQASDKGKVPF